MLFRTTSVSEMSQMTLVNVSKIVPFSLSLTRKSSLLPEGKLKIHPDRILGLYYLWAQHSWCLHSYLWPKIPPKKSVMDSDLPILARIPDRA